MSGTHKDPVVLSYKALRKAVGYVAFALPLALILPYLLQHNPHIIQGSLSAYYYTGMRNVFVGSLCALAMFMLCTRGYDKQDEYAGIASALCAIGVAFFPMDPLKTTYKEPCYTIPPYPHLHFVFAGTLFVILGYFCVVLFRKSDNPPTPQKLQRNTIYKICGITIYTAMACEAAISFAYKLLPGLHLPFGLDGHHLLIVEWICLWAFGYAWLVKGEAFFADTHPTGETTRTTDSLIS